MFVYIYGACREQSLAHFMVLFQFCFLYLGLIKIENNKVRVQAAQLALHISGMLSRPDLVLAETYKWHN